MAALCLSLLAVPLATACARTTYTNLHPQLAQPAPPIPDAEKPRSWRHFFLFGWLPSELTVDAVGFCSGTERIERIETRQSFLQGLIAAFAGYYINVYTPYTGRVVCDRHTEKP